MTDAHELPAIEWNPTKGRKRIARTVAEYADIEWTTREGQTLRLGDMTDRHLTNTATFLRNRADGAVSAYWSVGAMLQAENALYDWETSQDDVERKAEARCALADAMDAVRSARPPHLPAH